MKQKTVRTKSERGNAVLEFALCWPIFWLIFSGIYQLGHAFYIYNELMTSVVNAAAIASKLPYDNGNPSAYTNKIKNMVVYGDITAGTSPIATGLSTSNVGVDLTTSGPVNALDYVTVSIQSYSIDAFFTRFSLNSKPRVTVAYLGQFNCGTGSAC